MNTDSQEVERKFILKKDDQELFKNFLEMYFYPCNRYPNNTVHSIYYDTNNFNSFYEVEDGEINKTKYRLRFYEDKNGLFSKNAFIEIKKKFNKYRAKRRYPVEINSRDIQFAKKSTYCTFDSRAEFTSLIPIVHLSYDRMRFVSKCKNIKLNIDSRIVTNWLNPRVFKGSKACVDNVIIIEIKSKSNFLINKFIEYIPFIIETSHSKYFNSIYANFDGRDNGAIDK